MANKVLKRKNVGIKYNFHNNNFGRKRSKRPLRVLKILLYKQNVHKNILYAL